MSEDKESPVIVGVLPEKPEAWVPLEDYEAMRRKMIRFKNALNEIIDVLDCLTDEEQRDIIHKKENKE